MWPFPKKTSAPRAETNPPVAVDQPVENPALKAALAAHAKVGSDETAQRLFAELNRANYLVAMLADASNVKRRHQEGQSVIEKGSRLAILYCSDDYGRNLAPLFTDWREIHAWTEERISTLVMPADEAWKFIAVQSNYDGVVVNPAGDSLPLDRGQIASLQNAQAARSACVAVSDAENVDIENPELVALLDHVQSDPSVRSAIYRLLAGCNLVLGTREPLADVSAGWTELQQDTAITFLTTTSPDGGPALPAFTDVKALRARSAEAFPLGMSASQILQMVIEDGYDGIVLNPAAN